MDFKPTSFSQNLPVTWDLHPLVYDNLAIYLVDMGFSIYINLVNLPSMCSKEQKYEPKFNECLKLILLKSYTQS